VTEYLRFINSHDCCFLLVFVFFYKSYLLYCMCLVNHLRLHCNKGLILS